MMSVCIAIASILHRPNADAFHAEPSTPMITYKRYSGSKTKSGHFQ